MFFLSHVQLKTILRNLTKKHEKKDKTQQTCELHFVLLQLEHPEHTPLRTRLKRTATLLNEQVLLLHVGLRLEQQLRDLAVLLRDLAALLVDLLPELLVLLGHALDVGHQHGRVHARHALPTHLRQALQVLQLVAKQLDLGEDF